MEPESPLPLVRVTFLDESGTCLHEADLPAIPRIGEEVLIAAEKVTISPIKYVKALIWKLSDEDIPDPKYYEGTVVNVLWCFTKNMNAYAVAVKVKTEGPPA